MEWVKKAGHSREGGVTAYGEAGPYALSLSPTSAAAAFLLIPSFSRGFLLKNCVYSGGGIAW